VIESHYREFTPPQLRAVAVLVGQLASEAVAIPDSLWQTLCKDQPEEMRIYRMYRH